MTLLKPLQLGNGRCASVCSNRSTIWLYERASYANRKMLSLLHGMWHTCDYRTTGMMHPLISNPGPARHATTPAHAPHRYFWSWHATKSYLCEIHRAEYTNTYKKEKTPNVLFMKKHRSKQKTCMFWSSTLWINSLWFVGCPPMRCTADTTAMRRTHPRGNR